MSILKMQKKELNVKFHREYKEFIKRFGGACAGFPVYAFQNNEMMSKDTVIDLTNNFRADYKEDDRSDLINESYVISFDGMGNPIMISKEGSVIIFEHDSDRFRVLSRSLFEFIESTLDV